VALLTLTASHRDLDLDVLEQISSGAHSVGSLVVEGSPLLAGCVVLATCNRFELYLEVGGPTEPAGADEALAEVEAASTRAIAEVSGLPESTLAASLQRRTGPQVATHLFSVASGLDSMVVGEREVAGQVRRALAAARAQGTTSSVLERLFQSASRTSRAVGSRTGLASTGRSVVGVALDLARQELARQGVDLPDARVLLVGTGSYAGASLTALRARGVKDVAVHSPSGRAADFAAGRDLEVVGQAELGDRLADVDLVVCCSGAVGPVIDATMVADARTRSTEHWGRPRPVVLVDLALKHDVDPTVARVPGVRLVDLAAVQEHSPATVTPAVEAGRAIVAEHAAAFEAALLERRAAPFVVALRDQLEDGVSAELDRLRARGTDPQTMATLERSLRHEAATVLHAAAARAREQARR
jgi:glutamyl-tRNA reductase